jgi:hypothetical protein
MTATITLNVVEQGDNEEFPDFVSRAEDSACARGERLTMITADQNASGTLMMTPLGCLELLADPDVPARHSSGTSGACPSPQAQCGDSGVQ